MAKAPSRSRLGAFALVGADGVDVPTVALPAPIGAGDERSGTTVLELDHLGVRAQDPFSCRAEIDERRDSVLDADHSAESVHIVCDLVTHHEVLGGWCGRDFEGAARQMTLRCSWLCH